MQSQFPLVSIPVTPTTLRSLVFAARAELTDIVQNSTVLSQKPLNWRQALYPQASMQEDRVQNQSLLSTVLSSQRHHTYQCLQPELI
jgi:hypothetical protein